MKQLLLHLLSSLLFIMQIGSVGFIDVDYFIWSGVDILFPFLLGVIVVLMLLIFFTDRFIRHRWSRLILIAAEGATLIYTVCRFLEYRHITALSEDVRYTRYPELMTQRLLPFAFQLAAWSSGIIMLLYLAVKQYKIKQTWASK